MRKALIIILACCCTWMSAQMPVTKPNIGRGRLTVCHQNLHNYFVVDLSNTRSDYHTIAGLEEITSKLVQSLRYIDADIYALCELEVNDSATSYLTRAMNEDAGRPIYSFVRNNLSADNTYIMSGFIYRTDKVRPRGNSIVGSSETYYRRTMRIQLWEELATGEMFYLSQNHFKAKDSTADAGQAKRNRNASDLINALSRLTADPDILITGDLNETTSEPAVQSLIAAGYDEQLERFGTNPYSYYYGGQNQLIDHALANSAMASQVSGAGVFHINTGTRASYYKSDYWYSDHDPILVGLNLGPYTITPCDGIHVSCDFTQGLGDFTAYTLQGTANWYSSSYGAQISAYNKDDGEHLAWLVSPEYDLSGMDDAEITFRHNIYHDNAGENRYTDLQTLWYTTVFTGDPATTNWTQIPINNYAVKSWVDAVCAVPASALTSTFRFAFRYFAPSPGEGNYWEIANAKLDANCTNSTDLPTLQQPAEPAARKVLYQGQIYIIRGESVYTLGGQKVE